MGWLRINQLAGGRPCKLPPPGVTGIEPLLCPVRASWQHFKRRDCYGK